MPEPARVAGLALLALLWLGAWALADTYVSHGYSAAWYQTIEDEAGEPVRHLITRTTEHRVAFPNVHRPLARYVQGWPFERLELPTDLPAIDAELTAVITVPPGRGRVLSATADRQTTIFVDGRRAGTRRITPGEHRLRVRWEAQPQPHQRMRRVNEGASFELFWGGSDGRHEAVPRSALVPGQARWPASRVALWWAMTLGALLLAAWIAFSLRVRGQRRVERLLVIATVAVIGLGTAYRAFDYDVMPEYRENADELFATWNGFSLLQDGTTRGWSLWGHVYGSLVSRDVRQSFGETREVISPYFEHPPLMHVLVGAAAHLGGTDHYLEAKLKHTRLVPIALSAVAMLLIVLIGRRLSPRGPAAWLGALLYAVIPTISLQTRVIKEESLLVVLALLMVWLFLRWKETGKTSDIVLAAVCAGLAPLTKVPGAVFLIALVLLMLAEKPPMKRVLLVLGVGLGIGSLFFLYGALIDWRTFIFATGHQGTRPTHWGLFPRYFSVSLINHNFLGRGWILFLWLAFVGGVYRRSYQQTAVLTVPLIAYLGAIALGAGNWMFGWYQVPLYAFLCIGGGMFLAELWRRPNLLGGSLLMLLLVMYSLNFMMDPDWAKQADSWPDIRRMVMASAALMMGPYALAQVWPDSVIAVRLGRLATAAGLAIVVFVGGHFVVHYDTHYDTYFEFDRDGYFHR